MKKIIFFTNYFPKLPSFENFGTWALDQAEAISKNHKVLVISFVPYFPKILKYVNDKFNKWSNVYKKFKINENLHVRYIRINPFLFKKMKRLRKRPNMFAGYFYGKMKWTVKYFAPDLMIANHVMYEGYIANYFKYKMKIPYACFEHSPDDFIPENEKHGRAYKKTVTESSGFVNVSEYSYDRINSTYNFNNNMNFILYNYSRDAKEYKNIEILTRYGIDTKTHYIVEVANFENRKNHLSLLKIFNWIKDEFTEWNLLFVGTHDQTLNRINAFISDNGLEKRVRIIRNVRHSDVLNILNFMDIFVLPSDNEMFSVSVLEALSAGLPVISTIHNGLVDAVFNDSAVFNIDPANLTALKKSLTMLMKDEKKRIDTGVENRCLYEKYFTRDIYEKNIDRIIMNMTKE